MSEGQAQPIPLNNPSADSAPIQEPFTVRKRLAAAPTPRRATRTLGRRTRTEELPYGVVTRTEIPRTPLRRVSDVALGASVRATALAQGNHEAIFPLQFRASDLRRKVRSARMPNLILFVVDGSGSMAAQQRMQAVKGAILSLLLDAYQKRDPIGMITFRGTTAEVLLSPTKSVLAAQRQLADMPTGGRTPLAAGLRTAYHVVEQATRRQNQQLPLLIVLTDGRANIASDGNPIHARAEAYQVAGQIAARGWSALVIDCEAGYYRVGLARPLADALHADCIALDDLSAATLTRTIHRYLRTPRR